ncbi:uncharacterized protein LOC129958282 isoform X1 [Argiope bruennichi]|uniref:uncharacterized protein LOC129958282 isoform X1 n=1 Tax=Argiope bruennichi TaxID=94029 RepID=UPI0024955AD5|nr:uncharacterized protein LOC129958282 isoform X1 [Argiope bruennichi]XP_055926598.1 uncharacterized protein LOC129958282 isoform X1 [Argiope bruennichi]
MNSDSGTTTEMLSKAGVSDRLSDAQLLKKFAIKDCYIRLDQMKADEYDAAGIKSSQKITGSNTPFGSNSEFNGPKFAEKQNEHEVRQNPACNTKRLPCYEASPDIIIDREIELVTVNSESEDDVYQVGYCINKSDPWEHLLRGTFIEMYAEFGKKRRRNRLSNSKILKRCDMNNIKVESYIWEKQHKQNTAVQAINDGDMAKHQSPSQTKTSQLHLNNRNGSNSKVLKRKRSSNENDMKAQGGILERQGKRRKRNVQNRAVQAVNNEIEKEEDSDSILVKKYGLKNCFVAIPRLPPEIPELPQPQPVQARYGQQFMEEIAQRACPPAGNNVVDLDRVYTEAGVGQFSSLIRETLTREIKKFVNRMCGSDATFKN